MHMRSAILVFEDSSKSSFGGGQRVSLQVVDAVLESMNVGVVDFGAGSGFQSELLDREVPICRLRKAGTLDENNSTSSSISFVELLLSVVFFLPNLFRLHSFLLSYRRDYERVVLYSATKKSLVYAVAAKVLFRFPLVFHAHAAERRSPVISAFLSVFLRFADKIVSVSEYVATTLPVQSSSILYNAAPSSSVRSMATSKSEREDKKWVIASVGSLIPLKGHRFFVESSALVDNSIEAEFRVYGVGPLEKQLQELAEGYPRVTLKGYSSSLLSELSSEVDILVLPSISPEACPLTILESFALGLPLVTTNLGGQAELVNLSSSGILVRPEDAQEIADAIERLISDKDLYKESSGHARKSAGQFSQEVFEQSIRGVLDSVGAS